MANRQYIGARYVPKFYEGSNGNNWDSGRAYEPLTVVTYLNDSYTSKIPVPNTIGDPAHNSKYWAHTGAYNAQIEQYREQLINGQLGNGEYDADISPVAYADDFNFEDAFINHSTSETVETDDECPTPIFVGQNKVTYVDNDPTSNENFQYPVSSYNEAITDGYSANTNESSTQNFCANYTTMKHRVAGIVGGTCVGARMYLPSLSEAPAMATYGGNKGGAFGGVVFSKTEYNLGGYAHGMEIDMFDTCTEGTSPVYENNDYNVFTRYTDCLRLMAYGETQPVTMALAIGGLSNKPNGCWNGIVIGGSTMMITKNGTKQAGVKGTVGINFASWRDYNATTHTGGFGHTAIKFGKAYRHIDAVNGLIISSSVSEFINRNNNASNFIRMVSQTNYDNQIQFANTDDVTNNTIDYTVHSSLKASTEGLSINTNNHPIYIRDNLVDGGVTESHGVIITQGSFTPITTMANGTYEKPWDTVASNEFQLIKSNGVTMFIEASNDNNALINMNKPLRLVDRVNTDGSQDYGFEIGNGAIEYSQYQTKLGTTTKPWIEIHGTTLYLGNTSLTEQQLQSLLALI